MNRTALGLVAVALLFAQAGAAEEPLTLHQCVTRAKQHNPLVKAARSGVAAVEQQAKEAWWGWFPTIRLRTVATLIPPQNADARNPGDPDLSSANFWTKTDLEAYMPLYTFGKISAMKDMARHGEAALGALVRAAEDEVQYLVTRAWYALALSQEFERLIGDGERYVKKAKDRLKRLQDEDSDDFDQDDLFRLRIYEADVRQKVLDNQKLGALSRSGLSLAMGSEKGAPLALPAEIPLEPLDVTVKGLDHYVDLAYGHRPELHAARKKIDVQRAEVDRKWADFFPDFFIAGSFTYAWSSVDQQNTVFSSVVFNALGGGAAVGLQLTLDFPGKVARYRKAQADLDQASHEADGVRLKLRLELEEVWRDVKDLHEMVAINKDAEKAARALFVSRVQAYEDGVDDSVTIKDVLGQAVTWIARRSEFLKTVYGFNTQWAHLARVVGVDLMPRSPLP